MRDRDEGRADALGQAVSCGRRPGQLSQNIPNPRRSASGRPYVLCANKRTDPGRPGLLQGAMRFRVSARTLCATGMKGGPMHWGRLWTAVTDSSFRAR